jgi:hypothetical protein
MKIRTFTVVLGAVSVAVAQTPPAAPASVPPSPAASVAPVAPAPAAAAAAPAPIAPLEQTGQVPLDCDKQLGAYQFAKGRYEQKVKINTQTWEDVANYHSTRADWFECVVGGQYRAINAERSARNELIAKLNAVSQASTQIDQEIVSGQEQFALCDKTPVPADQALIACGPQAFVNECAVGTVKRLFAKENSRSGGPRAHVLRSIMQQALTRRVGWLSCVANHSGDAGTAPVSSAPLPAPSPPPLAQKAAVNR